MGWSVFWIQRTVRYKSTVKPGAGRWPEYFACAYDWLCAEECTGLHEKTRDLFCLLQRLKWATMVIAKFLLQTSANTGREHHWQAPFAAFGEKKTWIRFVQTTLARVNEQLSPSKLWVVIKCRSYALLHRVAFLLTGQLNWTRSFDLVFFFKVRRKSWVFCFLFDWLFCYLRKEYQILGFLEKN